MTDEDLYRIWEKVPVNYYQKGIKSNIFQQIWHEQKIENAKKILSSLKFNNCLDVGCASGYMISEVAKNFPNKNFWGIDSFDKAIHYAKKHYRKINFKIAMAEKLPFKDESFDLVIFYETIEHLPKPAKALQEIRRVLRPSGTLLLAMDSGNIFFRIIWLIWEKTKGSVWDGAHLNPFHHDELESLIRKSEFKIENKQFTHLGLEVVFILSKNLHKRDPNFN